MAALIETVFQRTLVSSAMRNDVHGWAYIKDILYRLLAGTQDYASLCPHVWKESHPEAIPQYWALERRDAADRKRLRRPPADSERRVRPGTCPVRLTPSKEGASRSTPCHQVGSASLDPHGAGVRSQGDDAERQPE
jgi:hypothetical protein